MEDVEQVVFLMQRVVCVVVNHTEAVKVTLSHAPEHIAFHVEVAQEDFGEVIGNKGRMARSLRTLTSALGRKAGMAYTLHFEEGPHSTDHVAIPIDN